MQLQIDQWIADWYVLISSGDIMSLPQATYMIYAQVAFAGCIVMF